MFRKNHNNLYLARAFEAFSWLEHGFGTRHSPLWPDSWQQATLRQIHSTDTLTAQGGGCLGRGDAIISSTPGCLLAVRTADCVPVLLADEKRRVVAAIHAGWRGTAGEIAAKTVQRLALEFGSEPGDIHAAIGPGIGLCCYRVGAEVAVLFASLFPERKDLDAAAMLDLAEANRRQLLSAGLSHDRIYRSTLCTCCLADEFHSYRRESTLSGRLVSAIGIRPEA